MYSQHESIDNMRFGSNSGIEDQTPQAVNYEKSSGDPGVDTTHLPPNLLAITETLQQRMLPQTLEEELVRVRVQKTCLPLYRWQ